MSAARIYSMFGPSWWGRSGLICAEHGMRDHLRSPQRAALRARAHQGLEVAVHQLARIPLLDVPRREENEVLQAGTDGDPSRWNGSNPLPPQAPSMKTISGLNESLGMGL